MKKNFKKTMTMLTALTITVGQCQIPAFADDIPVQSEITINTTGATVDAKNVTEQEKEPQAIGDSAVVVGEEGSASTVKGGDISVNNGTVTNNGDNSKSSIEGYDEDYTESVKTNNGTVYNNNADGTILTNDKTVTNNYGVVNENNGTVVNNGGTHPENDPLWEGYFEIPSTVKHNSATGTVTTNHENATVGTNDGTVGTNDGLVNINNKTVGTNDGLVNTNNKTVQTNGENGIVKTNDENGTIGTNYGDVGINYGTITNNYGTVGFNEENKTTTNDGRIVNNYAELDNNISEAVIENNHSTVKSNAGTIVTNSDIINTNAQDGWISINNDAGLVIKNNGTVQINNANINRNGSDDAVVTENTDDGARVISNHSTIQINNAIVETNTDGAKVVTNNGLVEKNYGLVETNTGVVYNYGGTVKDKSTGTEYFQISVRSGANQNKTGGDNLTKHDDLTWLAQNGDNTEYTEFVITPSADYYISSITNLPEGVTANRNDDGSWTLTIPSGTNIDITIPDAQLKYTNSDSGSDGGSGSSSSSGGSVSVNLTPTLSFNSRTVDTMGLSGFGTPVVMDSNHNVLTVDLTTVVSYANDLTSIANTFISSLVQVSPQDTVGSGTINPYNLYISSQAEGFYVPVSANVVSGTTYTVYYSNGDSYEITCNANGLLDLPIFRTKNIDAFNFVIVGLQATPIAPATA